MAVSPSAAALSSIGETVQLAAEVRDQNGRAMSGAAVSWASSDPAVATVDASGLAAAAGNGTATITATSGSASGTAAVTVEQSVERVSVTPDSAALLVGDTVRLSAAALDGLGHEVAGASFAWSSADTLVATVDSAGLVRAGGDGTATITATSGSASGSATVSVEQSVQAVSVTPDAAALVVGDTVRLSAEALDGNGYPVSGADFSWSSSDPAVATVDGSGLVRGVAEGAATITAAAGDSEGTSKVTVANPDRAALEALYNATDGPNWVNNENWLTDAPLGEWYGVHTDHAGRVARLDLGGSRDEGGEWISHGLAGPLPPDLGKLTELTRLRLDHNELTGTIPSELADLPRLTVLHIGPNSLHGPIPSELGNLAGLTRLDLFGNRLTGPIPPEFGNLANLEHLLLGANAHTGPIPSELGNLTHLRVLDLGGNRLTGPIPPQLGNLAELTGLHLGNNLLTGPIPPQLGDLAKLESLRLFGNRLEGQMPPSLGNLTELRNFDVGGNRLEGSVPVEFGGLTSLVNLRLWGNTALSGSLPATLTRLTSLRELSIEDTGLCAPGTTEFATWLRGIRERDWEAYCNESDTAVLESLYERTEGRGWVNSEGWLGGPALEEWHGVGTDSLGRVSALDLAGNGLSGELPYDLGLLTELTELRVGNNGGLAGRLPVLLTRLPLSVLHYAGTDLCSPAYDSFRAWLAGVASHEGTGAECAPLGEREVLAALYEATDGPNWAVSENWLTDAPLAEWHGVETDASGRIVSLDLENNGLTGPIPPELGGLTSLERLILYSNPLFGPIPAEMANLANLQLLVLGGIGGNNLTGPIPPELGGLANLKQLIVAHSGLSGPIPRELGELRNLEGLQLPANGFSGPIPPELGGLGNLAWLELSWNGLSGPIPPELGRLGNLEELLLDNNGLQGPIPPELGGLQNLTWLDFGANDLSGPIPLELGGLARLEILSLHNNDLSGALPSELGTLAHLRELDLTHNAAISGPLPASLTDLRHLDRLYARGTGLCAASGDVDLQAWLAGVRETHLADCAPAAAYLVQAVQSRAFPVPLVAGEDALLRVFVTAARESDVGMPPVRVRFHLDGTETHMVDIAGSSVPIPTEIDEQNMSRSANAVIPAEVVRPGLEMVIEVDPDGTLDPGLGVAERVPTTGRLAVDVWEMPRFDLTVIPFLWASEPDSSVIGIA